jgi:hypothetical protein
MANVNLLTWAQERRTKLLLLLLAIIIAGVVYVSMFQGTTNNVELWYYNHSDAEAFDDADSIEDTQQYLTSLNMSGFVKYLPEDVVSLDFWVQLNNYGMTGAVDDTPIYNTTTRFSAVLGGDDLSTNDPIGINYTSLPIHYAFIVADNGTWRLGLAERGYSIESVVIRPVNYSEWAHVEVELSKRCIKATIGNDSQRLCGEFERGSFGVEMYRQRFVNLSVYAYEESIVAKSASVLGFDEVSLPPYFVALSFMLSLGLALFLIVALKDYELPRYMRTGGFVILVWAIIMAMVLFRVIII